MNDRPVTLYQMPELHGPTGRALVACGFWMRVGFIGASAVAVGVIQLFGNETKPLTALALALGGAVLAAFSWRRAHTALGAADAYAPATTAAPAWFRRSSLARPRAAYR